MTGRGLSVCTTGGTAAATAGKIGAHAAARQGYLRKYLLPSLKEDGIAVMGDLRTHHAKPKARGLLRSLVPRLSIRLPAARTSTQSRRFHKGVVFAADSLKKP